MDSSELDDRRGARLATVVLFALIAYRALYHFGYAVENPLAHYPLADGEYYLSAAHDLIQAPPLGRDAFYLQGPTRRWSPRPAPARGWESAPRRRYGGSGLSLRSRAWSSIASPMRCLVDARGDGAPPH